MTKKPSSPEAQATLFELPDAPFDAPTASVTSSASADFKRGGRQAGASTDVRIGIPVPPHAFMETAARDLPERVHLGTSSWSFPGWQGLLYDRAYSTTALAHSGLAAYATHPLLRTVGIDRSFYAPLSLDEYRRYADQVPAAFRFVVKAPAAVCDAVIRGAGGVPTRGNPDFLNADLAAETFVSRCLSGLGPHAGPLVFQLSPLPDSQLADPGALVDRLGRFFAALPALDDTARAAGTCYALELRDPAMLTPRLVRMLRAQRVRYCVGIHSRMPAVARQVAALDKLDAPDPDAGALPGTQPLIVRWSLHAGLRYEGAKARYEPFDAIVDADVPTRQALAALILRYLAAGQSSFVIVNNKAEGSSPLSCAWLASALAALCGTDPEAGSARRFPYP